MSLNKEDEIIMRWIDGELDSNEKDAFENELEAAEAGGDVIGHMLPDQVPLDPERCRAERDAVEEISGILRDELSADKQPPKGDIFNAGIIDQIRKGRT